MNIQSVLQKTLKSEYEYEISENSYKNAEKFTIFKRGNKDFF